MEYLLSSSENILCENCRKLLHRSSGLNHTTRKDNSHAFEGVHHADGDSFFAAADSGCRLCSILLANHMGSQGSRDVRFSTSASIKIASNSSSAFIIITIKHQDQLWMPELFYTQLRLCIYPEDNPLYHRLLQSCRKEPLTEFTGDLTVVELAVQWLSKCTAPQGPRHETCEINPKAEYVPKRLLHISGENPNLSLRDHRTVQEPYSTLSYCWGEQPIQPILTKSNERDFCNEIMLSTLPKTIQDAIYVTKRLGVNYLWIDCLCIIQQGDDGADWKEHLGEMADIYSNCILNISADRARSANIGFLGKREWPPIRPVFTTCQLDVEAVNPPNQCVITFTNVTDMALATQPLAARGWVLSERILSPRTLHFAAGEMFWECAGMPIASESCPDGFCTHLDNFKYANYSLTASQEARECVEDWVWILTNYSRLSLSYPSSDKLVALAGISRLYERVSGQVIVAGILKSTLPLSLLWERPQERTGSSASRAPTYRAPSWSWASMDGPLRFYNSRDYFGRSKDMAEVLDVWVKPIDENSHLCQLADGAITLRGPTTSVTELKSLFIPSQRPRVYINIQWDEPDCPEINKKALALFLATSSFEHLIRVHAILVVSIQDDKKWIRVGILDLSFKNVDQEEKSMTMESMIMESQQFFKGLGTKTVTIV